MRSNNFADDKNIKHLNTVIDQLKKENTKLKSDNQLVIQLKDQIQKLQREKMEMSQKIIELESESLLSNNDILITPKMESISRFHKITVFEKINTSKFSLIGKKNGLSPKNDLKNKNEEISILKSELSKKDEIISELKNKKYKNIQKEKCINFTLTSKKNSNLSSNNNTNSNKNFNKLSGMKNKININSFNSNLPSKREATARSRGNDMIYEETESHFSLEKNIYSEIQNILEEKRNFILKTLTIENFSFDLMKSNFKGGLKKNGNIVGMENIDKLLEMIKIRKLKVEKNKKYFQENIA